ncbi:hypothetical protein [Pantoea stewartii]|uniref:hypothetical protein n=1 Tax=Pantoea stewartii TaxID=66269 RepID=UPI0012488E7C|nr:hypothetical protein [Pantoea stewartii]KAB0545784.1 hypothetical protein F7Q90_23225 [Pantoea stewartii subsp. stewartii]
MIIILCSLIVIQWLAVWRLNHTVSRLKLRCQDAEQERRRCLSYIGRLRDLAHDPNRNAIGGWLCLCAVEREIASEEIRLNVWQAMDALKAIIRITYDDYPVALQERFRHFALLQRKCNVMELRPHGPGNEEER